MRATKAAADSFAAAFFVVRHGRFLGFLLAYAYVLGRCTGGEDRKTVSRYGT